MPLKKHVKILKQGVADWNAWRKENGTSTPNFRRANLSYENFSGANFRYGDFFSADLCGTNLSHANFTYANLRYANLRGADLTNAKLNADLSYADLSEANLKEAVLGETIFGNTNLTNVKNLGTCKHLRPSTIDHQTITKSGNLPVNFLRGCGLPDSLIEYYPSLLNEPIKFYSCFISYSSNDEEFAKRLHADLQDSGVRCWFAPEDMKIGNKIRSTIDESIQIYDKLLIILSEQSVRSGWVEHEVETALEKEIEQGHIVLFPITLDDAIMNITVGWASKIKRERHIGNFREWKNHDSYKKAFQRLLHDLNTRGTQTTFERIQQELKKTKEELSQFQCPTCKMPIIEQNMVPLDSNQDHWDTREVYECGFETLGGIAEKICPYDPAFPKLDEYELITQLFSDDGNYKWLCYAQPKTKSAKLLPLDQQFGPSELEAVQKMREKYNVLCKNNKR